MDLSVEIAGVRLQNPVVAASGTFGYGTEFEDIVNLSRLGAVVTKGLSIRPMAGNPSPRLFETSAGMLNSVGLQNIGAEAFIHTRLPRLRTLGVTVIANVFGHTVEEYCATIGVLNQGEGIAAYELNASCPNTDCGGMLFGNDPAMLGPLVVAAKLASRRPLIVKLSPNVTSIALLARTAEEAGADALSLVNTFLGMAIDPHTRRPRFARGFAGLSGPAIKPLALRMVYECYRAVKIPILGMGGIATELDAVEFMLAGAAAVQIGTTNFWDPKATENVVKDLRAFGRRHGIDSLRSLTGAVEEPPAATPAAKPPDGGGETRPVGAEDGGDGGGKGGGAGA